MRETINGLEAEIDKMRVTERKVINMILAVETDLHAARLFWKRTKDSMSSLRSSNEERRKEDELNRIEEYGQSLLFKLDQSRKELATIRTSLESKRSELSQALGEKTSIRTKLSTLQGP
jgi:chromosome segregation ATPase